MSNVRTFVNVSVLAACAVVPSVAQDDHQLEADDFRAYSNVADILERKCLDCHGAERQKGGLRIDSLTALLKGGESGPAIQPGDSAGSLLFQKVTLPKKHGQRMPPHRISRRLHKRDIASLKRWIEAGAPWPEGQTIARTEFEFKNPPLDGLGFTEVIHAVLVERSKIERRRAREFSNYSVPLDEGVELEMIAIAEGKFKMGSPDEEAGRNEDEGPKVLRSVSSFWIGKYEVTWDQFFQFSNEKSSSPYYSGRPRQFDPARSPMIDAISQPTPSYLALGFGMGTEGYPATNLTQLTASKFCQWLSLKTGHFYRLPTETEWEYACRAGTTTPYSFETERIDDYAVFWDNSINPKTGSEQYAEVGSKLPNPWGLHDMHGNVAEWTLDAYLPDSYSAFAQPEAPDYVVPLTLYPRSYRGGSWYDSREDLRSAARAGSSPDLKRQDPALPKSRWYLTDAEWLGFRVVRDPVIPSVEDLHKAWNSSEGMTD